MACSMMAALFREYYTLQNAVIASNYSDTFHVHSVVAKPLKRRNYRVLIAHVYRYDLYNFVVFQQFLSDWLFSKDCFVSPSMGREKMRY